MHRRPVDFLLWRRVRWLIALLALALLPLRTGAASAAAEASAATAAETKAAVVDEGAATAAEVNTTADAPAAKGRAQAARDSSREAPSDTPVTAHLDQQDPALTRVPEGFRELDRGWFSIVYHPSLKAQISQLTSQAEDVRAELEGILGKPVLQHVRIYVGRTHGEMETLAPHGARLPKYAAGVAFSELGIVLLSAEPRFPGERHDLAEVFRHELAHVALHDAVGRQSVPRWFNEGFAIYASKEAQNARLQTLWTSTLAGSLLPFSQITTSFPADDTAVSIAYAQAADMVRFLLRSDEAHRFESLIHRLGRGQDFTSALSDAYSTNMFMLEKEWRQDVSRRYTFWPVIFGGSLVWIAAFGLLIFAYVKRKRRASQKLAHWAQEEALEDARRKLAQAVFGSAATGGPVRIVLSQGPSPGFSEHDSHERGDRAASSVSLPAGDAEKLRPVPVVEHEGEWHTLH